MNADARHILFTLALVVIGATSAGLTTLCLGALCGDPRNAHVTSPRVTSPHVTSGTWPHDDAPFARPASTRADASVAAERSDHNCNLMRF